MDFGPSVVAELLASCRQNLFLDIPVQASCHLGLCLCVKEQVRRLKGGVQPLKSMIFPFSFVRFFFEFLFCFTCVSFHFLFSCFLVFLKVLYIRAGQR